MSQRSEPRLSFYLPRILLFGGLLGFFAIGYEFNLFGHRIDWRDPATWAQGVCIPIALFGGGWVMGDVRQGLRTAGLWTLLLLGASLVGMLRT